jgi:hypothetical protein
MGFLTDLTNKRFGRLVVLNRSNTTSPVYWLCQCDCGNTISVQGNHLKTGNVKSCKCLAKEATSERSKKHGLHKTPEYKTWQQMKERCLNKNGKDYAKYGARGIFVYDGWINSFEDFLNYVGQRPNHCKSLDRIDNNGGYVPGNVRWATSAQQARNTRATKFEESDIKLIRSMLNNGIAQNKVAKKFNTSQQYISKIAHQKAWGDVA